MNEYKNTMPTHLYLDQFGYLWFKRPEENQWHDHPQLSLSHRVRLCLSEKPCLAGKLIEGVMIEVAQNNLLFKISNAIRQLKLPPYLEVSLNIKIDKMMDYLVNGVTKANE